MIPQLTNIIDEINTRDMMRIIQSDKEYVYFDISVCNAGAVIRVHCTNSNKIPCAYNGYDFIIDNDYDLHDELMPILHSRLSKIVIAWGKFCYDYSSHDEFLKLYKLTPYLYQKLLTICEG